MTVRPDRRRGREIMKPQMDLNAMMNQGLAELHEEGYLANAVKEQLKKTIDSTVIDCFGMYSDFGSALKKQVKSLLNVNFEKLDLPSYNVLVLEAVREYIDASVHVKGIKKMKEHLDEIIGEPLKEYKLSELIDKLKQDAREDNGDDLDGSEISLHVDDSRSLTFVYFDQEGGKSSYSCKYRLAVDTKTGQLKSATIDGKDFDKRIIMGGLYGVDRTLFKLFAHSSTLIIDSDSVETSYGYTDEY